MKKTILIAITTILSACKDENRAPQNNSLTNAIIPVNTNQVIFQPDRISNKDKTRAIVLVANQFETSFQRKYLHKTPYSKYLASVLTQQLNDVNIDKNEIIRTISNLPDIEPECLIEIKNIIDSFYGDLAKFYKTKNQILYYSTETMPAYVPKQKLEIENSNQLAKKSIETVIWFLKSEESNNICKIQDK